MATQSNRDKQNDVSRLKWQDPWVFHKIIPGGRYEFELDNIFIGEDFAELPFNTKTSDFDLDLNSEDEFTDFKIELASAFIKKYGNANKLEVKDFEIVTHSYVNKDLNITFTHIVSVKIFYKNKEQLLLPL